MWKILVLGTIFQGMVLIISLEKFMKLFERRLIFLLILLLVWSACASGALLYYSVYARERYLKAGQRLALRRGDFQATRGRILDRNGVSLAWSERYFDFYFIAVIFITGLLIFISYKKGEPAKWRWGKK